jgi:hypothetical protein
MKKQLAVFFFLSTFFTSSFAQNADPTANIKDGVYNYQDNKQSFKVVIKDDSLEKFELNGVLIPVGDYPKYDEIINNLMNKLQQHQKAMNQNQKYQVALLKISKKGEDVKVKSPVDFE